MAEAKICGLSRPSDVDTAIAERARWIGFVFFPRSPRHIEPESAAALARRADGRIETVAVTVDADDALLARIADTLAPDWIQAHGQESPRRVAEMRRFARRGVWKALAIATSEDLRAADAFAEAADRLLLDAKAPAGAVLPGGNGAAFDWKIVRDRRLPRPWLLSGGLTPDNVASAIAASGAEAVDVSSGVETAPGLKDGSLIARFLAAARAV
jgi:phosphoribosylanthranilate isomerase